MLGLTAGAVPPRPLAPALPGAPPVPDAPATPPPAPPARPPAAPPVPDARAPPAPAPPAPAPPCPDAPEPPLPWLVEMPPDPQAVTRNRMQPNENIVAPRVVTRAMREIRMAHPIKRRFGLLRPSGSAATRIAAGRLLARIGPPMKTTG